MTALDDKTMLDALATMQIIASLKLPKGTTLVGTKAGMEVHRKDGISYIVNAIEPRYPQS